MENRNVENLIIGAGVTGLYCAKMLEDNYLIVEKEHECGGYCRTIYNEDYVWDYAGHFFHFQNEKIESFFLKNIENENLVYRKKNTKIYYEDILVDFPFQCNIHQLNKKEFIECLVDLFEREEQEYDTFKQMLYAKFGKSIAEKFLIPYNEKLYACNLDSLDKNSMGRFFPYADIKTIISNMKSGEISSYNTNYFYPKRGAVTFVDAIRKNIESDNILLNQCLQKIDIKNKIAYTNDYEIRYQNLINTMPLYEFTKLIINKECLDLVDNVFSYNKVLVLNLGFDKSAIDKSIDWIYYPSKKINFYRVGFYSNILNQSKLSIYVEIGFDSKAQIDVKRELAVTLENLEKVHVIDGHTLKAYSAIVMSPAYVHISEKSTNEVLRLMDVLQDYNIYTIGRYGKWTYASIEDGMVDALNLVEKLKKQ